jgi:predicted  nucleic acid-binding Zn-ribbon protein
MQTSLNQIKTNKEYSAAISEIETLKKKKSDCEEELLIIMDKEEQMAREENAHKGHGQVEM